MYCTNYIYRVLRYHLWNEEKYKVPDKPPYTLPPNFLKQLFSNSGTKVGTKENKDLRESLV